MTAPETPLDACTALAQLGPAAMQRTPLAASLFAPLSTYTTDIMLIAVVELPEGRRYVVPSLPARAWLGGTVPEREILTADELAARVEAVVSGGRGCPVSAAVRWLGGRVVASYRRRQSPEREAELARLEALGRARAAARAAQRERRRAVMVKARAAKAARRAP